MNNFINISILVTVITFVLGYLYFILPYLKKKGVNVAKILNEVQTGLQEVKTGLEVVKSFEPNIPQVDVLLAVEKYAEIGVKKAQQLYISSQLGAAERKESAKNTIINSLKELNIPITDSLSALIDDIVESKVFDLKEDNEKKVASQNIVVKQTTQLQSQVSELTSTNLQLNQQIENLQSKLGQVQSVVQG
ncbi:MAG: hypothetical protein Q8936_16710 [Bacillota bacterium]|nr:hypothetical protein [Bacillota bacterium]